MLVKIAKTLSGGYSASVDGKPLIHSAKHPLPAVARALLAEGADPALVLDLQVDDGPVLKSCPLGELIGLPSERAPPRRAATPYPGDRLAA